MALDESVVGVLGPGGTRHGLGCLIADGLVLTCVHVLERASATGPGSTVSIDFPLVGVGAVPATVERWVPAADDGAGDFALLRTGPLPVGARPAPLVATTGSLWKHRMRTFGFPGGAGREGGVWHEGRLLARQGLGWIQTDMVDSAGYRIQRGFSGSPVWDDAVGGVVGIVVTAETAADTPVGYVIAVDAVLDAWPDLRTVVDPPCPYRKLVPFGEEDAARFHGRDSEADALTERIRLQRVVTVLGRSGSGKSSLVRAGLVPRLRSRGDTAVAIVRPGAADPLSALAAALHPLLGPDPGGLADALRTGGLGPVVARIRADSGASQLVVVVDQAEQLLLQEPLTDDPFTELLFGPDAPSDVHVVVTLRTDFLDAAGDRVGWRDAVAAPFVLRAMRSEQIEQAVAAPLASLPGRTFAPGLVKRIVDDAGSGPGALPLLGVALTGLWDAQTGGVLTHEAYDALGRVEGSLATYAQEEWARTVTERERPAAERLVRRLVRVPADGAPTRRVLARSALNDEDWSLAGRLAATRLLVVGRDGPADPADPSSGPTVELAHDALLNGWPLIADWVATAPELRVWHDGLRDDLDRWESAAREPDQLLRGTRLAAAHARAHRPEVELTERERDFLRRSEKREQQVARRGRRRRAAIAIAAVVAVLLGSAAAYQGIVARRESAAAASRALSAAATDQSAGNPADAGLLALAAYREDPTSEAANALFTQYQRTAPLDAVFSGAPGLLRDAAISRDGTVAAGLTGTGLLTVWTRHPGEPVRQWQTTPAEQAESMGLSPDGTAAWLKRRDGLYRVDVATGASRRVVPLARDEVTGFPVAVSADGSAVATGIAGPAGDRLVMWDARDGRVVGELPAPTGRLLSGYAFGPGRAMIVQLDVYPRTLLRWTPGAPAAPLADGVVATALVPGSGTVVTCRDPAAVARALQGLEKNPSVIAAFRGLTEVGSREPGGVEAFGVVDGAPRGRGPSSCSNLATDADGRYVASVTTTGAAPGGSTLLDLRTGASRPFTSSIDLADATPSGVPPVFPALLPGPDGLRVAAFSDSRVVVADLPEQSFDGVQVAELFPDGSALAVVADYGRTLGVAPTVRGARRTRVPRPAPVWRTERQDLAVDPAASLLAERVAADRIAVHQLPDLRTVAEIPTAPVPPYDPTAANPVPHNLFFDDGALVVMVGGDVTVWDARQGRQTAELDLVGRGLAGPGDDVSVTAGPRPGLVAVVVPGRPGVRVVDVASAEVTATVPTQDDTLAAVFGADGHHLRTLRRSGVLEVWDADQGRRVTGPLPSLPVDGTGGNYATTFTGSSGDLLVGVGNRIRTWSPGSPAPEGALDIADTGVVTGFSTDGRVASTQVLESGRTVSLDPEIWGDELCRVLGDRAFTPAERDELPVPVPTDPLCAAS